MSKFLANWRRRGNKQEEKATPMSDTARLEAEDTPESSQGHVVAYDENLLERSRTQWQFGDWESLASLQRDTLQHHPDRAKLALLAAAGHQQLGDMAAARQFTRLAQEWGCSAKLIGQILVAGVHNTLGRATAMTDKRERALQHFESAVTTASTGGDTRLLIQARTRGELEQLGLPISSMAQQGAGNPRLPEQGNTMHNLLEQLLKQNADLAEQVKKQSADLANIRKQLENTIKKEMLNATQQLEAFFGIQNYFNNGEHLPSMHGWPISPDFALYLIDLIDNNDYDLIIEFGSGTSTVLIAKTLAKLAPAREQAGKSPTVQVAFEHLEEYHAQTLRHLQRAGVEKRVQLELAPLAPYEAPNGSSYSYYICDEQLGVLAKSFDSLDNKVLIIVDGPPGSTNKHARYPALPILISNFKMAKIDTVLDDYIRSEEKETAEKWVKYLSAKNKEAVFTRIKMEKDAFFMSF